MQVDTLPVLSLDAGAVPAASTKVVNPKVCKRAIEIPYKSRVLKGYGEISFPIVSSVFVVGVSSGKGKHPCPESDSDDAGAVPAASTIPVNT